MEEDWEQGSEVRYRASCTPLWVHSKSRSSRVSSRSAPSRATIHPRTFGFAPISLLRPWLVLGFHARSRGYPYYIGHKMVDDAIFDYLDRLIKYSKERKRRATRERIKLPGTWRREARQHRYMTELGQERERLRGIATDSGEEWGNPMGLWQKEWETEPGWIFPEMPSSRLVAPDASLSSSHHNPLDERGPRTDREGERSVIHSAECQAICYS
ncbi:hypothetical protein HYDPIDRAFT_111041 [Hydnomerulius pinastri MD-312]|uniref:Uncharacterized protein n=1 Tax=Hydnomerulius pinastri MD-312 TaxID=994086 RepID=A0A0C9W2E2_9AGAM|nr:hypothetical protein HYDPIDRAFT_111041 [Hydnomerulius pinastri MD-312]